MFHRPRIFEPFKNLLAVETTRHGGLSPAPFSSLNFGRSSGDALENVEANKTLLCHRLGIEKSQLVTGHQTHGEEILLAEKGGDFAGFDAKMTQKRGIFLAVTVADCCPILIYDDSKKAVAAIHAGWRGTAARLVEKTFRAMQNELGSEPKNCVAWVGTCIDERHFEVGPEVAEHFSDSQKRWDASRQKHFVDLKKANAEQLFSLGFAEKQVEISPFSTVSNNSDFFSYRKEGGQTGRFWNLIGLF